MINTTSAKPNAVSKKESTDTNDKLHKMTTEIPITHIYIYIYIYIYISLLKINKKSMKDPRKY